MKNIDILDAYDQSAQIQLYQGDCLDFLTTIPDSAIDLVVTSPPYCMGKAYEDPTADMQTFKDLHHRIIPQIYRVLKPGGSICWQVGYHTSNACIVPLDYAVYEIFLTDNASREYPVELRNRIVWSFGHGLNSTHRFSGRHEMILWFTKGKDYCFNLDDVRIPQKYPGKRAYKGPNKGSLSGHPLGKNPSDVWDIPNVKAQHIEKTIHPCQFPVAIPLRLINALSPKDGVVFDPFMGSGTTGVAAIISGRRFLGSEIIPEYLSVAHARLRDALEGKARIREDIPVMEPDMNAAVAILPDEFRQARHGK